MPLFDHTAKRLADRPSVLFSRRAHRRARRPSASVRPGDEVVPRQARLRQRRPALRAHPGHCGPRAEGQTAVRHDHRLLHRGRVRVRGQGQAGGRDVAGRRAAGARPGGPARRHCSQPAAADEAEPGGHGLQRAAGAAWPVQFDVLQPFVATGPLVVDDNTNVPDSYALATEEQPVFFVVYWPPQISRTKLGVPPPALGGRCGNEPCRWMLSTGSSVEDTSRDASLKVGRQRWPSPAPPTASSSTPTASPSSTPRTCS